MDASAPQDCTPYLKTQGIQHRDAAIAALRADEVIQ
jgi:hypothetical protein